MKDRFYENQLINNPYYSNFISTFEKKRIVPKEISRFEKVN